MSTPNLPPLPISDVLPSLVQTLHEHTRVLLEAPPGAGKSTLVPLALHGSAWLNGNKILMLEPRRIAARAVAERMSQLLGQTVGGTVGYRTRLDSRVGRDTRIEVVTEGILTRLLQEDSALEGIGCVIFDEFHERSLNADLGLALTVEAQGTLRDDLRLLVMSATLDMQPLARLLNARTLSSAGRSFDVATHYVARRAELHLDVQLAAVIRKALHEHEGDVLCFLPGAAEITRLQRALENDAGRAGLRILPLYGDLSAAQQDAALTPAAAGERKVVLATSIAETSLTIQGIRIVVDAGLRRYSEFDPNTGMSRLVTAKVSQAAADQRRGRAGRLSTGVCYRLWSEGSQASLAAQTDPEIVHADLAPLALELACWGANDAATLTWLTPPPPAPLAQARDLLAQLDASDLAGRVTPLGRAMSKVGAHPRIAHMLLKASDLGAAHLACDLAAILSERDILRAAFGARDVDLRLRVGALRGETRALPSGISIDARSMALAKRSAQDWRRRIARSGADTVDAHEFTGVLLAMAYPDRVARARGGDGRYLLANGRGAHFAEPQALAKSEFIVAAELDGGDREAKIFLAAPLTLEQLETAFAAALRTTDVIVWDDREQAVRARREQRYLALLLRASELRNADPAAVHQALFTGIRQLGIGALPWTPALRLWQARVELMRRHEVPAPEPWPDLGDGALDASLEEWATAWVEGILRREHLSRLDLGNALRSRLSYAQGVILDREAPSHFEVPSGSRIAIDYTDGDIPTLSVRLQEVFGLGETPAVAAGRLPLLLKLLSPAGRPVQITRDLDSFWEKGYHEVKKDLKGRYPKHYWPDDPHTATPTRRARPR